MHLFGVAVIGCVFLASCEGGTDVTINTELAAPASTSATAELVAASSTTTTTNANSPTTAAAPTTTFLADAPDGRLDCLDGQRWTLTISSLGGADSSEQLLEGRLQSQLNLFGLDSIAHVRKGIASVLFGGREVVVALASNGDDGWFISGINSCGPYRVFR